MVVEIDEVVKEIQKGKKKKKGCSSCVCGGGGDKERISSVCTFSVCVSGSEIPVGKIPRQRCGGVGGGGVGWRFNMDFVKRDEV